MGVGNGLRSFYKGNFQPRVSVAYRPFGDNKTVFRAGFGIFTMTSLGQLSFNTTNINVGVVRTTLNQLPNGQPSFQFPQVRTPDDPLLIAGTGDFYQNVNLHYRDPQSAQWNVTIERALPADLTLRVSYAGMNSYRMGETVDLNQVQPGVAPYEIRANGPIRIGDASYPGENLGFANYQSLQSELRKH